MNINIFCMTPMSEIAFDHPHSKNKIGFKKWTTSIPNWIYNRTMATAGKTEKVIKKMTLKLQCINWKKKHSFLSVQKFICISNWNQRTQKKCNCIAYQLNLCDMLFPPQRIFQFGSIGCQKIITVHDDMYKWIDYTKQCTVAACNFNAIMFFLSISFSPRK